MVAKKNTNEWLTVRELSIALNISERTLRDWIARRTISHSKIGRLVRIPASELTRLTDAGFVPVRGSR